jgi:UPF0271 protein
MPARRIDFNCDLGEGCGSDAAIMPFISSASIACGGHAGDAATMRATVQLCLDHGVAIGAHPSFEDREQFGRREVQLPCAQIAAMVGRQIQVLARVCGSAGARLQHVKPHGALYNLAARDRNVAAAIAEAVLEFDGSLVLFALSGSEGAAAAEQTGVRVAHEVFAERRYEADGRLTPRSESDAVIEDVDTALSQVRTMLREGIVVARTGQRVPVRADTLCLHGDRTDAPDFARALRQALEADGIAVLAPGAAA